MGKTKCFMETELQSYRLKKTIIFLLTDIGKEKLTTDLR